MRRESNENISNENIGKYVVKELISKGEEVVAEDIRPGFFMQNVSGIHAVEIKEKGEIFIPAGRSKTSFIDAADISLSIPTLLHEPEKYKNTAHTITGSESLDYYQIAEIK